MYIYTTTLSLPHKPYIVATVHSEQVIEFASEIVNLLVEFTNVQMLIQTSLHLPCKICELSAICKNVYARGYGLWSATVIYLVEYVVK